MDYLYRRLLLIFLIHIDETKAGLPFNQMQNTRNVRRIPRIKTKIDWGTKELLCWAGNAFFEIGHNKICGIERRETIQPIDWRWWRDQWIPVSMVRGRSEGAGVERRAAGLTVNDLFKRWAPTTELGREIVNQSEVIEFWSNWIYIVNQNPENHLVTTHSQTTHQNHVTASPFGALKLNNVGVRKGM